MFLRHTFNLTPLLLLSCRPEYDPNWERVTGPDGRIAYALECSRTVECYELASELCVRGYETLSSDRERDYDPAQQRRENLLAPGLPAYTGRDLRVMLIACKAPQGQQAAPRVTYTPNRP